MKKHRFLKQLLALAVIAALAAGLWFSLSGRQTAAPENPLENLNDDFSHMLDHEPLDRIVEEDMGPSESEATATPEPTQEPSPEPTETPEPTAQPTLLPPRATTPTPDAAQSGRTPAPTRQSGSAEQPPLVTPRPDEVQSTAGAGESVQNTQVVYFTTTILNGSTIPSRELDFTITHKQPSLSVQTTSVYVNGAKVSQFNGRVLLEDGKNTVKVEIVYADPEGHAIKVSKTYTVYVRQDSLIITTDLKDMTLNQQSLSFTAYASYGSRAATLQVFVNGEAVSSGSNRYKARLNEGANEILLSASGEGKVLEQRFSINVELPEDIEFITDLYDHEVDDPEFRFTAAITGGTARAQLTVVANGVTLSGQDGVYSCALARGNNLIRLKSTDVDGREYTQSYTIAYHHYIILEDEDADETMPRITANIYEGMEISGSMFTLMVGATDGAGKRIYGDHLTVQLNATEKHA